jgi:hypothetical protein
MANVAVVDSPGERIPSPTSGDSVAPAPLGLPSAFRSRLPPDKSRTSKNGLPIAAPPVLVNVAVMCDALSVEEGRPSHQLPLAAAAGIPNEERIPDVQARLDDGCHIAVDRYPVAKPRCAREHGRHVPTLGLRVTATEDVCGAGRRRGCANDRVFAMDGDTDAEVGGSGVSVFVSRGQHGDLLPDAGAVAAKEIRRTSRADDGGSTVERKQPSEALARPAATRTISHTASK